MKRIWFDPALCLGCKTCALQCAVERGSLSRTLRGAVQEDPPPFARVTVCGTSAHPFALQCRHCENATCLAACPSGALHRDAATGLVALDQNLCRGCWMCVMTCPFGAVTPVATYRVAAKCDACMHMDEPACVSGCPTGALRLGDEADYQKTLAARRGAVALWVAERAAAHHAVCLDSTALEGTPA